MSNSNIQKKCLHRQIMVDINPDVVHVRSRMPAWVTYRAFKNFTKKRPVYISTFHGLYSFPIYSKVMAKVDHVISISKTVSNLRASLFHIGFFIQKTPDATHLLSLDDLKVEAKNFALQSMKRYCEDMHLIHELSLNQA